MNDFIVRLNNSKFNVKIINEIEIILDDEHFNYELLPLSCNSFILKLNNKVYQLTSEKLNNDLFKILFGGNHLEVTVRTALQEKALRLLESSVSSHHRHLEVRAPMPGLILKLRKKVGDQVELGESVIILEAMKMENDIKAPASGIIEKVYVSEGLPVEKGVILFSIS